MQNQFIYEEKIAERSIEWIPRILRDIDDGVLALDQHGSIIYMNPQASSILGVSEPVIGNKYAEVFFEDSDKQENDALNQFILDSIYQKGKTHQGTILYIAPSGEKRYLKIKSSFLKNEVTGEKAGVAMVLSDVTETELIKKKKHDATVVFVCITACICLYLLLLAFLDFLRYEIPTKVLTQVINGMVVVASIIIYRKTDFSVDDLGLRAKNARSTVAVALIISALTILLLMGAKYLIMQISPDSFSSTAPFWNWDIGLYSWVSYVFTCILQEFLARSMVYGSIRKLFDGKNATLGAIALSSLLFGAVHIAHGFMYMILAILLLGALGGLYAKQRNIWGVTIIHFILGQTAHCLGFIS